MKAWPVSVPFVFSLLCAPTTTIRLDPQDISRARVLAAARGVRYQTYLKMLIHEALAAEEKKLAKLSLSS